MADYEVRVEDGKLVVPCRSTGCGAKTTIVFAPLGAKVTVQNRSNSGKHWEEVVEMKMPGYVSVRNITNTGKHECFAIAFNGETFEIERENNGAPNCSICS